MRIPLVSLIVLLAYILSLFILSHYLAKRSSANDVATFNLLWNRRVHWAWQILLVALYMTALLYFFYVLTAPTAALPDASPATSAAEAVRPVISTMQILVFLISAMCSFQLAHYVARVVRGWTSVFRLYILPLLFALAINAWWMISPNWASVDLAATVVIVSMLTLTRVANVYTAIVALTALALYDIVNVFATGLMVKVALPSVGALPILISIPESLSMSAKTVAALGLGDIVIPGLVVLLAFREAKLKANRLLSVLIVVGYIIGLTIVDVVAGITRAPQPALLYISPMLILCLLIADPLHAAWKRICGNTANA